MSFTDGAPNRLLDGPNAGEPSTSDPSGDGWGSPYPGLAAPTLAPTDRLSVSAPPVGVYGPEHWAAADAVSSELMPTLSAALRTPPGLLTRQKIIGDTSRMLASVRAGGVLSDEQFDQVVAGAAGFLGGVPDGPDEQARRNALLQLGAQHTAAKTRLAVMTGLTPTGGSATGVVDEDGADGPGSNRVEAAPSPGAPQGGSDAPAAADGAAAATHAAPDADPNAAAQSSGGAPAGGNGDGTQAVDSKDSESPSASGDPDGPPGQADASPQAEAARATAPAPTGEPRPGSWLDHHREGFIRTSSAAAAAPMGAAASGAAPRLAPVVEAIGSRLGIPGALLASSVFLKSLTAAEDRAQVGNTIRRFGLDPTQQGDVQAARAYVWASNFAGFNSRAGFAGPSNEAAAQAVMWLERAQPGVTYLAAERHFQPAIDLIRHVENAAVDDWKLESRPRPRGADAAYRSKPAVARAVAGLAPNDPMVPHHLVQLNSYDQYSDLIKSAYSAGWNWDANINLISLPATVAKQQQLAAAGINLPLHVGSHSNYDNATRGAIALRLALLGHAPNPQEAADILRNVAMTNLTEIYLGRWNPRMN